MLPPVVPAPSAISRDTLIVIRIIYESISSSHREPSKHIAHCEANCAVGHAHERVQLPGTMYGSDVSMYHDQEVDAAGEDLDVPDELMCTLAAGSGCAMDRDSHGSCALLFGPSLPPSLPAFHAELVDAHDNHIDIDIDHSSSSTEDGDTKKSFDFTGELARLSESGGSDLRCFVEQLENAHLGVVSGESDESGGVQEEEEEGEDGMSASGCDGGVESRSPGFYGFADSGPQLVDPWFQSRVGASRIVGVKAPFLLEAAEIISSSDSPSPVVGKTQIRIVNIVPRLRHVGGRAEHVHISIRASFTFTHSSCFVNVVLAIHLLGLISPSSLAVHTYAREGKGGFEIYVDSSYMDPDIGEIVLVKMMPQVTLDGVRLRKSRWRGFIIVEIEDLVGEGGQQDDEERRQGESQEEGETGGEGEGVAGETFDAVLIPIPMRIPTVKMLGVKKNSGVFLGQGEREEGEAALERVEEAHDADRCVPGGAGPALVGWFYQGRRGT
ncbi:hypothetical protein CVT25_006113 [Psilocybe cyanescens]|uniref:Uncharacterized protein n=1 Tax=Psilocybe cyanescens TaxID=93625 RepID=A0A409X777_PSICY|nr:hypothetical protein CVT25_006113 [Psilocybe cyanescens]